MATLTDTWNPANELEQRLSGVLQGGDQDTYFRLVGEAELFLPLPPGEGADAVMADRTAFTWPTSMREGRTHVLSYTSQESARACLGPAYEQFVRMTLADMARAWPDQEWWLAVNSGLPIEAYLPAWFIAQLTGAEAVRETVVDHVGAGVARAADHAGAGAAGEQVNLHITEGTAFTALDEEERALHEAATRGDRAGFLQTLLNARQIWVPTAAGADPILGPGRPGFQWYTQESGGQVIAAVFTGPGRMREALGDHPFVLSDLAKILRFWENPAWELVVNGGTPIGATIAGQHVRELSERIDAEAAARLAEAFPAQSDAERQLFDARGDADMQVKILLDATVFLPVWSRTPPTVQMPPGDPAFPWSTVPVRGQPSVLAFTSFDWMKTAVGTTGFVMTTFADLTAAWPDPGWSAVVNPATPIEVNVTGAQIRALTTGEPVAEPEAAEQPTPPETPPGAWTIMQKIVPREHVEWYLESGYDRVAGFVHRVRDVIELGTPDRLYNTLGLLRDGTPVDPADAEVHVIRWPAYRTGLYRTPFGGTTEEALREWGEGGWVVEGPPFRGDGFAPGSGGSIPEFKVDSVRLPHGSEMYVIGADGSERFVARYDADRLAWGK